MRRLEVRVTYEPFAGSLETVLSLAKFFGQAANNKQARSEAINVATIQFGKTGQDGTSKRQHTLLRQFCPHRRGFWGSLWESTHRQPSAAQLVRGRTNTFTDRGGYEALQAGGQSIPLIRDYILSLWLVQADLVGLDTDRREK